MKMSVVEVFVLLNESKLRNFHYLSLTKNLINQTCCNAPQVVWRII